MRTNVTSDNKLDAVDLQHRIRTELSKELSSMTHKEEIEFFKEVSNRAKKRRSGKRQAV